tara:strand:+ start:2258 stop:3412 length:1155 start_codon:yes stop_codon:yes gene_type:complete
MNHSLTHFDPYTFQPLAPDSRRFDEFVYLLQSCMNDEGLFTKANMSRIKVDLPTELIGNPKKMSTPNLRKRHKFFGDFNLVSRIRYLFFCDELCLVIDQDRDIYFKNPNYCHGDLQRVTRRTHRLLITSSESIEREAVIQSRTNPKKATIMNGRAELNSKILLNHKDVIPKKGKYGALNMDTREVPDCQRIRLIVDLPDNLDLFTSNFGSTEGYLTALLNLLRTNIVSLPSLFNGRRARDLSTEEFIENSTFQIDETSNIFMSLYKNIGIKMKQARDISYDANYWEREFELDKMTISWKNHKPYQGIGTSGLTFFYTDHIRVANTTLGQFNLARGIQIPGINPLHFSNDEDLIKATESMVQYVRVFREDFLITSKRLKACIETY